MIGHDLVVQFFTFGRRAAPDPVALALTTTIMPREYVYARCWRVDLLDKGKIDGLMERVARSEARLEHRRDNTACAYNNCRAKPSGLRHLVCAGCGVVRYCSTRCHKHDWKNHKSICRESMPRAEIP